MKLVPTDDQRDLSAMLRTVLAKECPTSLVRELKRPESDGVPRGLWDALNTAGVFGLAVDERFGGAGAGLAELGVFFAEAGRALCPPIVYSTLVFGIGIDRLGTPDQRERYLTALAAGELRASIVAWNPSDAGDLRPVAAARRAAGGWTLSGTLPFVPYADVADVVLVTARVTEPAAPDRVLGFLVDPSVAGWDAEPLTTMAGDKQSRVTVDGAFVPDDAVLDGPNGHGLCSDELAAVAHAALALQCREMAGGAATVLERTVSYIGARHQFGRPIGSFQAAQHLVADMHIAIEGARLAAEAAAWWLGRGERAARQVATAKMACSQAYTHATLTAHQLHGGMGYVRESDLHLWSERAKVTDVQYGTADVAARWLQQEVGLV